MSARILIFIVAYQAETTIRDVLTRIPASLAEENEIEVLIIDDASRDATFHEASAAMDACPFKVTVLANPVNQGYGGNQKIGFHYAIRNGFDVVALVHGDGQYAPESLPDLIPPILEGRADVVFGSRMMTSGAALKGGMPLYKYVGNKILTAFENAALGANLTEFHSGYRIYSVRSLKSIPFFMNTPDFHFDTEIIIQLLNAKQRILELPIPTYYGDEICHVNGMKYAWDVVKAATVARLQRYHLLYQEKYDVAPPGEENAHYAFKGGFDSSHTLALDGVGTGKKILDLGSGPGHVGRALRDKGCHVTGIDLHPPEEPAWLDRFIQADLNDNELPVDLKNFDAVLLLDVVEHTHNPSRFVRGLARAARKSKETDLIVTTGNVAFGIVRLMLLFGFFNYGKKGILDLTHTRLFTFYGLRNLFEENGFRTMEVKGVPAPFPLVLGETRLARFLTRMNLWLIKISKGFFSYQIYMRFKPTPTVDLLLESAFVHSAERREEESVD